MIQQVATLSQIYYVVLPLLLRAGQILVTRQRELVSLGVKERRERGQEIEEEIRSFLETTLMQLFPKHSIYTGGKQTAASSCQWIVQPLDGGRYYFRGLPLYTTSLALKSDGEVVLGIIVAPASQSVFHAFKGEGSFLNNEKIHVSEEKSLTNVCAYIENSHDDSATIKQKQTNIQSALIKEGVRLHTFGVSSLGLCFLASGAFDAFLGFRDEVTLSRFMAGLIIVKEAGALIMDGEGKPLRATSASNAIVVAAPGVIRQCLMLVRGA